MSYKCHCEEARRGNLLLITFWFKREITLPKFRELFQAPRNDSYAVFILKNDRLSHTTAIIIEKAPSNTKIGGAPK